MIEDKDDLIFLLIGRRPQTFHMNDDLIFFVNEIKPTKM